MKVKNTYKELIFKTHNIFNESRMMNIINNEKDKKFKYYVFNKEKNINIIKTIYKYNKKNDIIKILGEKFVNNNKQKCKIIINNKQYNIKSTYNIKNEYIYTTEKTKKDFKTLDFINLYKNIRDIPINLNIKKSLSLLMILII